MRRAWGAMVSAAWVMAGCTLQWPRSQTAARDAEQDAGLDAPDVAETGDVGGEDGDAGVDGRDAADAAAEIHEDAGDDREGADSLELDVPIAPDADVPLAPDVDAPLETADLPRAPDADVPVSDACVGATCVYASCAELPAGSMSGVYNLRTFGGGTWRGYCDVPTDGSAPWTLVMKVDGAQTTFQYDAAHWYTGSRYNDTTADTSEVEAKYEGFNSTPFREIRLQTSTAGSGRRDVVLSTAPAALPAVSLASAMQMRSTPPTLITGTSAWATAFPGATLQSACTRFGFNVNPVPGSIFARVRIGGVGDESDPDCSSPQSWVGVGGFVNNPACTPLGNTLSAGNVDGCNGATPPRRVASFVWIWVR